MLDPAVGSGAFPMGVLHKLTLALRRLDPGNALGKTPEGTAGGKAGARRRGTTGAGPRNCWNQRTFAPAREFRFGRKLYLMQNGIFGVDIQPVACQITKLRFFISLVIEQQTNDDPTDNYGIQPLPNLETRFVAANSLIGLDKPAQHVLGGVEIKAVEDDLRYIRERYFSARDRSAKLTCMKEDKRAREKLAGVLEHLHGFDHQSARAVANWDLYDQNAKAAWFDPEWMFGIDAGFDVVIGNPPYVESRNSLLSSKLKDSYASQVLADWGESLPRGSDLLIYFYSRSAKFLNSSGCGCFITQNAWLSTDYGQKFQHFSLAKLSFKSITDTSTKFFSDTRSQNINAVITIFHKRKAASCIELLTLTC